jgi:hypothetical protein
VAPTIPTIPVNAGCAGLLEVFNTAPEAQAQLLPLLQALGCNVPPATGGSSAGVGSTGSTGSGGAGSSA